MSYDKNLPSLVLFKVGWCSHCQHFLPTWEALKKQVPANKLNMVTVDCEENNGFCSRVKSLTGYPSIYFSPVKGGAMKYMGARDPVSLVDYVNNAVGYELIKF